MTRELERTARGARIILAVGCLLILSGAPALEAESPSRPGYAFDRTISREVLESYLSRAITMEGMLNGRGDLDDDIRMLKWIGAKFIGRSLCLWGGEADLLRNLERARQEAPRVHQADPDMVLQACIFEIVTTQVDQVPVPDRVFVALGQPVEQRNFRYADMLYPDGRFKDHWRRGQSVPDVSRLETKLWFYYLGTSFIDVGCEAIHLGQTELMNKGDPRLDHYSQVLGLIRDHAATHARRHIVLCDSHVPSGGLVRDGRLLMDFHSFPLRIKELPDKPQEAILEVGFSDGLYGRSRGGTTPSGWSCEHLPYLVEIDNWGSSARPGQAKVGGIWVWGYDEISWFAHQGPRYRADWLRYARDWVRRTDGNAHLQMPGGRVLAAPVEGKRWYHANRPSPAVPGGFGDEEAIRSIWANGSSVAPQEPAAAPGEGSLATGLAGYWKLRGDCRDGSGLGHHGVNHGVDLAGSRFDGRGSYVEVPADASLDLGAGDFSFSVWVWTAEVLDDVIGDVLEKYDPDRRRGITLSIDASAGGYSSQSGDRHVHFGIDDGRTGEWRDCGRPNPTSNYISNSLTVYRGKLFAAATDAKDPADWSHVYRYEGEDRWVDCGRVGSGRTTGVGPMIVHDGSLYAVTWTYDWTRVGSGAYDAGRVYRYAGGTTWEDRGQPSDDRTINCMGSFRGKLYVGGGPETWGVFVEEEDGRWRPSRVFDKTGPERCFPHAMSCYNGKLYVAYPGVYSFDGETWTFAGVPSGRADTLQTHSFEVFQGKLCAGTWPEGKVAAYQGGESWQELGRVGVDGTEVNALLVYNGKLYGGSIPRAEVCRYDGSPQWTSLRRFHSPDGWGPAPPSQVGGSPTRGQVAEWSRVTSLTVFEGRLFAGIGSCTSSVLDAPADVRGRVFSMEAGRNVSYDDDLGPGWKHLAAVRERGILKLYVDGRLVSRSAPQDPAEYDVSTARPLRIGFGATDYFAGRISELRAYRRTLSDEEVGRLFSRKEHP